MPASVPVNIFLWCWIKIIFIVRVLVEVKFANMFYDLKKNTETSSFHKVGVYVLHGRDLSEVFEVCSS